jgi:2-polyprenyl-3-methyl-5-hydroxy-6-metoxy-1,4-benzoquinol methylase
MKVIFQKEIGYSPLDNINLGLLRQIISVCRLVIDKFYQIQLGDKILVAGAGEGHEAIFLCDEYKALTVGIDININSSLHQILPKGCFLQRHDLRNIAFCDNSFQLIYCYHVLEHVPDPIEVLNELNRVLKPGGILFIGFPNRHRLFAYINTSQNSTIWEKICWNINDYKFRIKQEFLNNYGAHAGFTEKEFKQMILKIFSSSISVRKQYFLLKYKQFTRVVNFMIITNLAEVLFPSNYFICAKNGILNDHG